MDPSCKVNAISGVGFIFAYKLPRAQSKQENKLYFTSSFHRWLRLLSFVYPGCFLMLFFPSRCCFSCGEFLFHPLPGAANQHGPSPPFLHLIPLTCDCPEVGCWPLSISTNENLPRGWYTDFGGSLFPTEDAKLEKYESGASIGHLPCPEEQAGLQWEEMKVNIEDRSMERERVLCAASWLLSLCPEAWLLQLLDSVHDPRVLPSNESE